MEKKQLTANIMFFIVAFIIFLSSAFAWFNLSTKSDISSIDTNVDDLKDSIKLKVKRNNGEFHFIDTQLELTNLFKNTVPGDSYTFEITIENKTNKERSLFGTIQNIESKSNDTYDLKDVFYLSQINHKTYDTNNLLISDESHYLTVNSSEPATAHGQLLNQYRITNLINQNNNLLVFSNLVLNPKEKVVITFSIIYDIDTENINYQYNELTFDSIFVLGA